MKKQTKVLLAAAMLTLGASFSSMAALKNGTWIQSENGWQYADRDGEMVEEEWCLSYGVEYWINDEGYLGSSEWVLGEDGHSYYVQSDGSKTINAWKYIYGEDDEAADEESWFYFDSKGRMVKNDDRTINEKVYHFGDDGKMLTGWVNKDTHTEVNLDTTVATSSIRYHHEDGSLAKNEWINEFPWEEDYDECYVEDDLEWYWAQSAGAIATGKKKDTSGLTYIFDADGRMLTGWVEYDGTSYANIDDEVGVDNSKTTYYCDTTYGYVKMDQWKKLGDVMGDGTYWFHFDKLGRAFVHTSTNAVTATASNVDFEDGEMNNVEKNLDAAFQVSKLVVDGKDFYFNAEGEMLDGFVTINDKLMLLDDGYFVTGKTTITDDNENDYEFYFAEKTVKGEGYTKYVAIEGNKDGYCYKNGQLMTSDYAGVYEVVPTAAGSFVVDYRGKIQHKNNKEYEGLTKTYTFRTDLDGAYEYSIDER